MALNALLWTLLAIYIIEIVGKLSLLALGRDLTRTRGGIAADAALAVGILAWIAVVLAGLK